MIVFYPVTFVVLAQATLSDRNRWQDVLRAFRHVLDVRKLRASNVGGVVTGELLTTLSGVIYGKPGSAVQEATAIPTRRDESARAPACASYRCRCRVVVSDA